MPERSLAAVKVPTVFARHTGIPNTSQSKSYFASCEEAMARCVGDPRCVGISAQRLFYGSIGLPRLIEGRQGESECIMRCGYDE